MAAVCATCARASCIATSTPESGPGGQALPPCRDPFPLKDELAVSTATAVAASGISVLVKSPWPDRNIRVVVQLCQRLSEVAGLACKQLGVSCGSAPEMELSMYGPDLRELPLETTMDTVVAAASAARVTIGSGAGAGGIGTGGNDLLLYLLPYKALWEEYWRRSRGRGADPFASGCGSDPPTASANTAAAASADADGSAGGDRSASAFGNEPPDEPEWLPLYWHLWMSDAEHTAGMTASPPDGCPPVSFVHDPDTPLRLSLDVFAAWMGIQPLGLRAGTQPGAGAVQQAGGVVVGRTGPGSGVPDGDGAAAGTGKGTGSADASSEDKGPASSGPDSLQSDPGATKRTPSAAAFDQRPHEQEPTASAQPQLPPRKASQTQQQAQQSPHPPEASADEPPPAPPSGCGSWCRHMEWLRGGGTRMLRLLAAATSTASASSSGVGSDSGSAAASAAASSAASSDRGGGSRGSSNSSDVGCKGLASGKAQPGDGADARSTALGIGPLTLSGSSGHGELLVDGRGGGSVAEGPAGEVAGSALASGRDVSASSADHAASGRPGLQLLWLNRQVSYDASPAELGMCDQSVVALLNLCDRPDCPACLMTRGSLTGGVDLVEQALQAGGLGPLDELQQPPQARLTPAQESSPAAADADGCGGTRRGGPDGGEGVGCRPPMLMPLGLAAANGHEAVLELLLGRQVDDPNVCDKFGLPALWFAVEHGQPGCVRLLLQAGARAADWVFASSSSAAAAQALATAVAAGGPAGERAMAERTSAAAAAGLPVAVASYMCLSHAVEVGEVRTVRELLRFGACPYTPDDSNGTPYHLAIERGDVEMVQALLDGDPAFDELQRAQGDVYRRLVHLSQRVERSEVAGCPCVQCNYRVAIRAATSPEAEELRAQLQLVALPAVMDAAPPDAAVALMSAMRQRGALLDAHDADGYTALHLAVRAGNLAAIRWLLQSGADPQERDSLGYMPLHLLAHYGCSAAPPPAPVATALAFAPAPGGAAAPGSGLGDCGSSNSSGGSAAALGAAAAAASGGQLELAAARLLVEDSRMPLAAKTTCFAYEADVRSEEKKLKANTLANLGTGGGSGGRNGRRVGAASKKRSRDPMLTVPLYGGHTAAQLALRYGRPLLLAYLLHRGAPMDLSSATSRHCLEKALEAGHSAAARILLSYVHQSCKPGPSPAPSSNSSSPPSGSAAAAASTGDTRRATSRASKRASAAASAGGGGGNADGSGKSTPRDDKDSRGSPGSTISLALTPATAAMFAAMVAAEDGAPALEQPMQPGARGSGAVAAPQQQAGSRPGGHSHSSTQPPQQAGAAQAGDAGAATTARAERAGAQQPQPSADVATTAAVVTGAPAAAAAERADAATALLLERRKARRTGAAFAGSGGPAARAGASGAADAADAAAQPAGVPSVVPTTTPVNALPAFAAATAVAKESNGGGLGASKAGAAPPSSSSLPAARVDQPTDTAAAASHPPPQQPMGTAITPSALSASGATASTPLPSRPDDPSASPVRPRAGRMTPAATALVTVTVAAATTPPFAVGPDTDTASSARASGGRRGASEAGSSGLLEGIGEDGGSSSKGSRSARRRATRREARKTGASAAVPATDAASPPPAPQQQEGEASEPAPARVPGRESDGAHGHSEAAQKPAAAAGVWAAAGQQGKRPTSPSRPPQPPQPPAPIAAAALQSRVIAAAAAGAAAGATPPEEGLSRPAASVSGPANAADAAVRATTTAAVTAAATAGSAAAASHQPLVRPAAAAPSALAPWSRTAQTGQALAAEATATGKAPTPIAAAAAGPSTSAGGRSALPAETSDDGGEWQVVTGHRHRRGLGQAQGPAGQADPAAAPAAAASATIGVGAGPLPPLGTPAQPAAAISAPAITTTSSSSTCSSSQPLAGKAGRASGSRQESPRRQAAGEGSEAGGSGGGSPSPAVPTPAQPHPARAASSDHLATGGRDTAPIAVPLAAAPPPSGMHAGGSPGSALGSSPPLPPGSALLLRGTCGRRMSGSAGVAANGGGNGSSDSCGYIEVPRSLLYSKRGGPTGQSPTAAAAAAAVASLPWAVPAPAPAGPVQQQSPATVAAAGESGAAPAVPAAPAVLPAAPAGRQATGPPANAAPVKGALAAAVLPATVVATAVQPCAPPAVPNAAQSFAAAVRGESGPGPSHPPPPQPLAATPGSLPGRQHTTATATGSTDSGSALAGSTPLRPTESAAVAASVASGPGIVGASARGRGGNKPGLLSAGMQGKAPAASAGPAGQSDSALGTGSGSGSGAAGGVTVGAKAGEAAAGQAPSTSSKLNPQAHEFVPVKPSSGCNTAPVPSGAKTPASANNPTGPSTAAAVHLSVPGVQVTPPSGPRHQSSAAAALAAIVASASKLTSTAASRTSANGAPGGAATFSNLMTPSPSPNPAAAGGRSAGPHSGGAAYSMYGITAGPPHPASPLPHHMQHQQQHSSVLGHGPPPASPVAQVVSWQAVQPIQVLSSPIRRLPDLPDLYRAMVSPYCSYMAHSPRTSSSAGAAAAAVAAAAAASAAVSATAAAVAAATAAAEAHAAASTAAAAANGAPPAGSTADSAAGLDGQPSEPQDAAAAAAQYNPLAAPLPQLSMLPHGLYCGEQLIRPTATRLWGVDPLQQLRATQTSLDATIAAAFGVPGYVTATHPLLPGALTAGGAFSTAAAAATMPYSFCAADGVGVGEMMARAGYSDGGGDLGFSIGDARMSSSGGGAGSSVCSGIVRALHSIFAEEDVEETDPGELQQQQQQNPRGQSPPLPQQPQPAQPQPQQPQPAAQQPGRRSDSGRLSTDPRDMPLASDGPAPAPAGPSELLQPRRPSPQGLPAHTGDNELQPQQPPQQQQPQQQQKAQPTAPVHPRQPGRLLQPNQYHPGQQQQQQQQRAREPSGGSPQGRGGAPASHHPHGSQQHQQQQHQQQLTHREGAGARGFRRGSAGPPATTPPGFSTDWRAAVVSLFTGARTLSSPAAAQPAVAAAALWWTAVRQAPEPHSAPTSDGDPAGSGGSGPLRPRRAPGPETLPPKAQLQAQSQRGAWPGRARGHGAQRSSSEGGGAGAGAGGYGPGQPSPPQGLVVLTQRVQVVGPMDVDSMISTCLQGRLAPNTEICGTMAGLVGPPPLELFEPLGALLAAMRSGGGCYMLLEGW